MGVVNGDRKIHNSFRVAELYCSSVSATNIRKEVLRLKGCAGSLDLLQDTRSIAYTEL